jgi:gas vesicle protein
MKSNGSSSIIGPVVSSLFLGGLIGSGISLLAAPASGKEARQKIVGLAQGVTGKVGDYYEQIKETVTSALEEGKCLVDEKKRLITKAVQAGIEVYEREKVGTA